MGLCCSQREKPPSSIGSLLNNETRLAMRLSQLEPPIKHSVIKRYDWSEISKFLEEAEFNEDAAFRNILEDIKWRIDYLPVDRKALTIVLMKREIFLYESDTETRQILIIKPFSKSEDYYINDYILFITYFFEEIQRDLENHSKTITLLIDFEEKGMSVNLIRDLYRFMTVHYPRRLAQILVVRCNDTFTNKHEEQLKRIQKLCVFKEFNRSPLVKLVTVQNLVEEFSGERVYYYLGDSLGRVSDKT